MLTGGKEPIVVRTYGEDLKTLRAKSDQILALVSSVPGVVDAHRDISSDVPQVEVTVNLAKAERYGLKPGDVRRDAATLVAGEEVGDIFRAGKAYDVVVWSPPQTRHSFTDIANLPIDTPVGRAHPAGRRSPPWRCGRTPTRSTGRVTPATSTWGRPWRAATSARSSATSRPSWPRSGWTAGTTSSCWANTRSGRRRRAACCVSAIIAGVLILLLLQASFRRWRLAVLTFLTLPMALVGGVLAAWLAGGIISLGSLVGFFTVFGIAARNGILLINHCQHLEEHEGMEFGPALVLRGARERLSPILMTSLATGLALVPLVVLGARPGHEIEHPLAVVILGGLFTSTLLNLFVVPSLYLRFGHSRRSQRHRPAPAKE